MLTLKKPIQLHNDLPLTLGADAFGQKIMGNYSLLGSRVAPKELLFLLTAPPELPEDLGGMTTIVVDQSNTDNRAVTMEVVNNVVNRILLDGTNQFTYQDQVYITSVLNRLGVTDVAQFMTEVRRLRVENESVIHLNQLYRDGLRQLLIRQSVEPDVRVFPIPPAAREEGAEVRAVRPRVEMAMSILERLNTARIVETVHAFQNNRSQSETILNNRTLRLSEQLRLSRDIRLVQTKQQVFESPDITLLQHWNRYEHMDLENPARTEEQVLSQAAAAALVSAVDNTVIEVLSRSNIRNRWMEVRNALWQTAEHAMERFEQYHSVQNLSTAIHTPGPGAAWNQYMEELREYRELHLHAYHQSAPPAQVLPGGERPAVTELTHLERVEVGEDQFREWITHLEETNLLPARTAQTILERELPRRMAEQAAMEEKLIPGQIRELIRTTVAARPAQQPAPAELHHPAPEQVEGEGPAPGTVVETHTREQERHTHTQQTISAQGRPAGQPVPDEIEQILRETIHTREGRDILRREVGEAARPVELTHQIVVESGEETHPAGEVPVPPRPERPAPGAVPAADVQNILKQIYQSAPGGEPVLPRSGEAGAHTPQSPVTERVERLEELNYLTPQQAEEEAPEALIRRLHEIDQQNRKMVESLERQTVLERMAGPTPPPVPDVKRTMRDALRSLEDPEALIREIAAMPPKAELEHRISPQEEILLQNAGPRERAIYETVLAYQRDPEGALRRGLLKPGTMGGLQAGLMAAEAPGEPLELEHPGQELYRETQRLHQETQSVLERFQRVPGAQATIYNDLPGRPAALKFVHKQAPPDVTEELMEQMQQRQVTSTVRDQTQQSTTRIHTTDLHQVEHNMVTQTTQDVTELVNRALSKQMRTITDQVYKQMERKLQIERSRRGRF